LVIIQQINFSEFSLILRSVIASYDRIQLLKKFRNEIRNKSFERVTNALVLVQDILDDKIQILSRGLSLSTPKKKEPCQGLKT